MQGALPGRCVVPAGFMAPLLGMVVVDLRSVIFMPLIPRLDRTFASQVCYLKSKTDSFTVARAVIAH